MKKQYSQPPVYYRHLHCPQCERANRPFKREAGITMHRIQFLKYDGSDAISKIVCLICGVKPTKDPSQFQVVRERLNAMNIKSWDALINIDPEDDGFTLDE